MSLRVYFAQVGRHIKVGSSVSPERRIRILKSHNIARPADFDYSAPIELLATVPGTLTDEWLAHQALADFRVAGEWFVAEQQVLDWIAARDGTTWPRLERANGPVSDEHTTADLAVQHAATRALDRALTPT